MNNMNQTQDSSYFGVGEQQERTQRRFKYVGGIFLRPVYKVSLLVYMGLYTRVPSSALYTFAVMIEMEFSRGEKGTESCLGIWNVIKTIKAQDDKSLK